jgi:hypothetical protein
MPKLKKSDWIIIGIMLLVIAGISYGIYGYSAQIAKVAAARRAKEAELVQIRAKVAGFGRLQEEVAANETEMQRLATYIPDREGQANFITELSGLTLGSKVKLQSCRAAEQPTPFPNLPEYQVYHWDVTFESLYPQLLRFLENLPAQKRSTLVSKINISAGAADETRDSQYLLNVQLTMDLISRTAAAPQVARTDAKKVSQ